MMISSLLMGIVGIFFLFLPHEILNFIGIEPVQLLPLLLQVMGAMYFAFAMINWLARYSLIGGIYSKPVSMGNFSHFMIGALALIKGISSNPNSTLLWSASIFYLVLAVLFGYVSFTSPVKK